MDFKKTIIGILAFIGGLISKIIYDIYENYKKGLTDKKKFDKKIYLKIKDKLLPLDGGLGFIKDFNFAGFSFKLEKLKDLFYINDTQIDVPELKFLDKKLEKYKNELFSEIQKIVYEISINTFPLENRYQRVPSEWEIEQPERFNEVVNKLHSYSLIIWEKYNNFIDYGRNKFKV